MIIPEQKKKGFIIRLYHSFGYALNGFKTLITEEVNARVHTMAAIIVIAMGLFLEISLTEWLILTIVIGLVFAFEIMNTAIENLADYVSPSKQDAIKKVKDLGAAGVLASAIIAIITGLIIFLPKIIMLF